MKHWISQMFQGIAQLWIASTLRGSMKIPLRHSIYQKNSMIGCMKVHFSSFPYNPCWRMDSNTLHTCCHAWVYSWNRLKCPLDSQPHRGSKCLTNITDEVRKSGRCFGKAKRHNLVFKVVILCSKSCLPFVP